MSQDGAFFLPPSCSLTQAVLRCNLLTASSFSFPLHSSPSYQSSYFLKYFPVPPVLLFTLPKLLLGLTQSSVASSPTSTTMCQCYSPCGTKPREVGGHTTASSQCVSQQHLPRFWSLVFLQCQLWSPTLSSWSHYGDECKHTCPPHPAGHCTGWV